MGEDQEMENFRMENDSEDVQWIGCKFYYGKRKEKCTQTREDVLYGVFAVLDDDDDNDYCSRKRRKDRDLSKKDLTKPVSFVSADTFMPNQDIDNNSKEQGEKDSYVSEDRPGIGLGIGSASTSGSGFGFRFGYVANGSDSNDDSDENFDDNFLPTAFGKIKEGAMRRKREREREKLEKKRGQCQSVGQDGFVDVGKFEKYTKGRGMKLMEKMGYKGGGLGKNEQVILARIEVKLRAKNAGIGFNDFKETTPLPTLQLKKSLQGVIQPTVGRTKERLWSKQSRLKKKKEEEENDTSQELLASKQEQDLDVVQKVYDMRGLQGVYNFV